MDFTREPIIETIITPKEGYKLVIRSSKTAGQEEYFVDAVEIVAFGGALFFRSMERPKAFLVPVSDYEILEVREARMVLKNVGLDRSIKIGGGKEANIKAPREEEKIDQTHDDGEELEDVQTSPEGSTVTSSEVRVDKKRDRRRHYRKRRGRDDAKESTELAVPPLEGDKIAITPPGEGVEAGAENLPLPSPILSSLLQPPPTLISETINRYRQNDLFKGAFYLTEEEQYKPHDKVHELLNEEDEEEGVPTLQEPTFETPESSEDSSSEEVAEENRVIDEVVEGQPNLEEERHISSEVTLPIYAQEEDPSMKEIFSSTQPEEKDSHDHHHHHDHHDHFHHTEHVEQESEKNQE